MVLPRTASALTRICTSACVASWGIPVPADCAGTSNVLVCAIAGVAIATAQIAAEVARELRRSRYRIYSSPYERPDYSGSHGHDARERIFRFCRPNLFQFSDTMIRRSEEHTSELQSLMRFAY